MSELSMVQGAILAGAALAGTAPFAGTSSEIISTTHSVLTPMRKWKLKMR